MIDNKDEFEEIVKKQFIKSLIKKCTNKETGRIFNMLSMNSPVSLGTNVSILKHFNRGLTIEKEYNQLFKEDLNNNMTKELANVTVKLFTDGITPIREYEYAPDTAFNSSTFNKYLKNNKSNFINYYTSRYENQKLKWIENMSTLELEYKIKEYTVTFKLLYDQADLFFLIENEYEDALNNLKVYSSTEENYIEILETYNTLNKVIMKHDLTKFLISKKIFIVTKDLVYDKTNTLATEIQTINIIKKISKDKVYDCSKIKYKKLPSKPTNAKKKSKSSTNEAADFKLVLNRIDYTKAIIVRFLKHKRDEFISSTIIFEHSQKELKKRFILEKELFQKTLDALVEDEYIKKEATEPDAYCYLP